MSKFGKKIETMREKKYMTFYAWITAKFLLGLGVGMLLASYFLNPNWIKAGWFMIALGIVFAIPAIRRTRALLCTLAQFQASRTQAK